MRNGLEKLTKKLYSSIGIGILACATIVGWGGIINYAIKSHPDKEEVREELRGIPVSVDITSKSGGLFGTGLYLSGIVKDEDGRLKSFAYPQYTFPSATPMTKAYSMIKSEINDGDDEQIKLKTTYNPCYGQITTYVTANGETIQF